MMAIPIGPSAASPRFRVVVANLPPLIEQIVVEAIRQEPDMEVTFVVPDLVSALRAVKEGADLVVLGAQGQPGIFPPPGVVSHLLTQFPSVRVLVMSTEVDAMGAYWMAVRFEQIHSSAPGDFIAALRGLAEHDALDYEPHSAEGCAGDGD